VLLVDIGNTRIKWARFDGERLGTRRSAVHSRGARRLRPPAVRLGASPEGMLVASVAGSRVDWMLAAAAGRAEVRRIVTVPRRAAGVTVGYLEPWRFRGRPVLSRPSELITFLRQKAHKLRVGPQSLDAKM